MAIDKSLIERFKMKQTADAINLKTHINEVLKIDNWEISEYCDVEGTYHKVLALKVLPSGDIYRTEVAAFIEKFASYAEVFKVIPVDDRPYIKITGKTSRKKNEYISFEITDESGNPL